VSIFRVGLIAFARLAGAHVVKHAFTRIARGELASVQIDASAAVSAGGTRTDPSITRILDFIDFQRILPQDGA
jgi:hypothetical protein